MKRFYFTFGCGQIHENYYHVIEAKNENEARKQMNLRFDNKWSMVYNSAEEAGVDEFNLKEI